MYRDERARKAGITLHSARQMLNELMEDVEFFGIEASDARTLFEYVNEIISKDCPEHGIKYSAAEIEVLIIEMIFDTRWQLYFANMQWRMEQAYAQADRQWKESREASK